MLQLDHSKNSDLLADPFDILPIKEFISRINKQLQHLVALMQREHELLTKGNADQISEIAQDKLMSMQELSTFIANYFNDEVDNSINEGNSLEYSLKSVNEICLKHKIEEWNEIKDLLNYCHDLSEENSILLANRLKYTNNAIDTLFSLAGSTQSKTYDERGLSQNPRSSRQLASV